MKRWHPQLGRMFWKGILLGAVLACLLATGTDGAQSSRLESIDIALFVPLSGGAADFGNMGRNGALMAVEDINAAGGIKSLGGAKLNLIVGDVTSDPSQAPNVVERVLTRGKLVGAVGAGGSGTTVPVLPVIEKRQVPMVTLAVAKQVTGSGYKYIFQLNPMGDMFGAMQVEFLSFLKKKHGVSVNKLAFLYEDTAYGTATASGLRKLAEQEGYKVVIDTTFRPGLTDASPLVTAVRSAGAEVLFPVAYPVDAALLVTAMHQMKYLPILIGGGAAFTFPDIHRVIGDKVNGIFSVSPWNWDNKHILNEPQRAGVVKRYRERFGTFMPEPAGGFYISTWVLKEGIEAAASADSVKVRDALARAKITQGPGAMMQPGTVEFDDKGYNKAAVPVIVQWQRGEPRTVYPESSASSDVARPGS